MQVKEATGCHVIASRNLQSDFTSGGGSGRESEAFKLESTEAVVC